MRLDRTLFLRLLPLVSLFIPVTISAFNRNTPFDISADMIDYVDADQSMTAEGHVVVVQASSTLKADYMRYERTTQRLTARGHVFLNDQGSIMMGETLDYDLRAESGTVTNALGYQSPWIFSGADWGKQLDYLAGHDAAFTSCDLPDPHYRFRSRSVHLVPDNYFWAWSNLAYADTLPVFYSPFIYRNLAARRVVMQFRPGYDDVNGNFLKTVTTVRFTDLIYDRVYLDHFAHQGNGLGNELNYSAGQARGSLFGYYINPHGSPEVAGQPGGPQYSLRSYHWQQLTSALTLQANVNLRKNVSFNNQYFPQDTNQSVNEIVSSLAMTHQKDHINQRLVVERMDAPDAGDTSPFAATHIQTASLPRYDFTLFQIPIWNPGGESPATSSTMAARGTQPFPAKRTRIGPLMFNANLSLAQDYERFDEQLHPNGQGSFTFSQSIPLSRQWSFTPTLTPQLNWQQKFDAQPPPPAGTTVTVSDTGLFKGFQGRISTADTIRWRPLSSLTLDQTYTLTGRMEANGLGLDRGPTDGGIETHRLAWLAYWRPSRRLMLRTFSGYDMRHIANEDLSSYQQRKWDPLTSELTLQPTRQTEYFFRYQLGYYPFRGNLWEGTYRYYGPYNTLLQTGLLYNRGTEGFLTWNNEFGLFLSPGWRVDVRFHSLLPSTSLSAAIREGTLIDSEFLVTRDMHCWQAQFLYRNRPPLSREYSVMLSLKLGVKAEKEISNTDIESQYYPWRARPFIP